MDGDRVLGRRAFLGGAAAAAAALTIVKPGSVHGAEAANTLELGLIGCGGRGNWIANLFQANAPWKIVAVASNEPADGQGDGDTAPDWVLTGDHALKLRAERAGNGSGRVYTITIQATDASGNAAAAEVTVTVPHDKKK